MMVSRYHHLSTFLLLLSPAQALSFPPLQPRDAGCPDPSSTHCAGFPSSFCCPSGHSCLSIDGGSSLICCDSNTDCNAFRPIPCDVSLQNSTLFPTTLLMTTKADIKLPSCGDQCCPAGYKCQGGNACINENPRSSSSSTSAPSSTATSPSSSSAWSASSTPSTASAPSSDTSATPIPDSKSDIPPKAVLIGFFPDIVAGILIALAGVICLGRRRKRTTSISSPILQDTNCRTDFLRLSPQRPADKRVSRVRSLFRRDTQKSRATTFRSSSSSGEEISVFASNLNGHTGQYETPVPPLPVSMHTTPMTSMPRTPESGALGVYNKNRGSVVHSSPTPAILVPGNYNADPRASTMTHKTTFTDLMEDAGLRKNEQYIGVPAAGAPPVPPLPAMGKGVGGAMASAQQ